MADAAAPLFVAAQLAAPSLIRGAASLLTTLSGLNPNAAISYLQVFDSATAGAVTVGTTVPNFVIPFPANGVNAPLTDRLEFFNGIVIAATTTPGGAVAPGVGLALGLGIR